MFGYVTPNEELLTKEQMDRFRRVYCGVCSCLRENCGRRGRFTLTYDAAFLALLLDSLYEPGETLREGHCPLHPLRRVPHETGEMTAYAADVNTLLCYYSLLDGARDDNSRLKKKGADLMRASFEKAAERRPDKAALIRENLEALTGLEKADSADIDAAAGCFGRLLGGVFAVKDDMWSGSLFRMGDALGRYIYILDAYCDLKKDLVSGSYNPLRHIAKEENYEQRVHDMLKTEMALCAQAFETLPIVEDVELLRNVIYSGVWSGYTARHKPGKREDADGTGSV